MLFIRREGSRTQTTRGSVPPCAIRPGGLDCHYSGLKVALQKTVPTKHTPLIIFISPPGRVVRRRLQCQDVLLRYRREKRQAARTTPTLVLPFCPQAKSFDGDSNAETLPDGIVVRTLEKVARSTGDAMSGLEDAINHILGSSSGVSATVREQLTAALRKEARKWEPGVSMAK